MLTNEIVTHLKNLLHLDCFMTRIPAKKINWIKLRNKRIYVISRWLNCQQFQQGERTKMIIWVHMSSYEFFFLLYIIFSWSIKGSLCTAFEDRPQGQRSLGSPHNATHFTKPRFDEKNTTWKKKKKKKKTRKCPRFGKIFADDDCWWFLSMRRNQT